MQLGVALRLVFVKTYFAVIKTNFKLYEDWSLLSDGGNSIQYYCNSKKKIDFVKLILVKNEQNVK